MLFIAKLNQICNWRNTMFSLVTLTEVVTNICKFSLFLRYQAHVVLFLYKLKYLHLIKFN